MPPYALSPCAMQVSFRLRHSLVSPRLTQVPPCGLENCASAALFPCIRKARVRAPPHRASDLVNSGFGALGDGLANDFAVVYCHGVVGVEVDGLIDVREGAFRVALVIAQHASVVEGFGIIGLEADGLV